jgi:hypothetical protein
MKVEVSVTNLLNGAMVSYFGAYPLKPAKLGRL